MQSDVDERSREVSGVLGSQGDPALRTLALATAPSVSPAALEDVAALGQGHLRVGGVGSCAGTLGELFQGPIHWRGHLEIVIASLPFQRRTRCRYVLHEGCNAGDGLEARPKTARAVELLLARHELRLPPGGFQFDSELEVGKGMASSTADIVAALRCVGRVTSRRFRVRDVMDVLREVERSDSVFLSEAALYLSERHEVVVRFGRSLSYTAAYLVEPGTVDTESARDCLLAHYRRCSSEYRAALQQFIGGAVQREPYLVAAAATESARLSQRCLPKARFLALRSAMQALGADGMFVAHTGSVLGYLYVRPPCVARRAELERFFAGLGERVRFDRVGWSGV